MIIVAHRGASWDAPENTLAAFRLAWDQQADAVELDLRLSGDGRLMVHHDADTRRTCGRRLVIANSSIEQLGELDAGRWKASAWAGERIPELAEVIATTPPGRALMIELKSGPEIVPALSRVLLSCGLANSQITLMAFDVETMRQVKRALPDIVCHQVVSTRSSRRWGRVATVDSMIAVASEAGLDGLNLDAKFVIDAAFASRVHAAGLGLHVWTVNDPVKARALKLAGVDGITTDRPGFMREVLSG